MSSDEKAKLYTFYSYKGGVGRSMALANIAELFYQKGLRVLMIDFDLEAPGLEQYFYNSDDPELQKLLCKRGVIDLLFSYKSLRSLATANANEPIFTFPEFNETGPPSATDDQMLYASSSPPLRTLGSLMAEDSGESPEPPSESPKNLDVPTDVQGDLPASHFPYPVEPLSRFIAEIYPARADMPGTLSIITAGRRAKEQLQPQGAAKETKDEFALYADRVRSFTWDDFYLDFDGERFFDWFRQEAIKNVDIVIIDSRTGVAEMSGVCTYQLADVVVMFVAPNNQNVEGIKRIADSLTSPDLISEGRKGRALSLILVPSRVDLGSEKLKLDDLTGRFREVADKFISTKLQFETNAFVDLMIPYISYYSFVEEIAVRDTDSPAALKLVRAYEKICRTITQLDPILSAKIMLEAESADSANLAEQLNRTANHFYDRLSEREKLAARSLLTRLVRVAQKEEGVLKDRARVVKFDDLTFEQLNVAENFSDQELLIINRDDQDLKTVSLAKEGLIQHWIRLKEWIEQDREFLQWRQNLQSTLSSWEKSGRSSSDFLAESRLEEAQKWLAVRQEDLNGAEVNYILASLALRRRNRLRSIARVAAAVISIGIVVTTSLYYYQQWRNRPSQEVARSRQLASKSETLVTLQPELSVLLAVEAARSAPTAEAQQALKDAWLQSHLQAVIRVGAPVHSGQFSHDGKRIVTGSGGGTSLAQVWQQKEDGSWQSLAVLRGHKGDVTAAVFSPDDQLIATASEDTTAILWDARSGERIGVLKAGPGSLTDIDWSPSGEFVAAAALDNMVYVWEVKQSPKLIQRLKLFRDNVNSVSFSPNGQFLAAGSKDKQIYVWDTKDLGGSHRAAQGPLLGHTDSVLSVRFSKDSRRLVTAGGDDTARVWETSDWRTVTVLSGHLNAVTRAAFSADGKLIVTASADNTAIVWDAATGQRVVTLSGSVGFVNDASFSPDGRLILTASGDGSARLWELNPTVNPNSSLSELAAAACTRLARNMTVEEWRQNMGNEPYRSSCPNIPLPEPTSATSAVKNAH